MEQLLQTACFRFSSIDIVGLNQRILAILGTSPNKMMPDSLTQGTVFASEKQRHCYSSTHGEGEGCNF